VPKGNSLWLIGNCGRRAGEVEMRAIPDIGLKDLPKVCNSGLQYRATARRTGAHGLKRRGFFDGLTRPPYDRGFE
jgi:hypothetical protein